MCVLFFFFKQNTANELRISDWSSDVCSSDLLHAAPGPIVLLGCAVEALDEQHILAERARKLDRCDIEARARGEAHRDIFGFHDIIDVGCRRKFGDIFARAIVDQRLGTRAAKRCAMLQRLVRSEEHTSELQSLMRISYAVFCLKKK